MTDTSAQFMLPVDESAPPERLRWPMLLAAGAAVVLIHLALFTVFTPLAPEPVGDAASRADRATSFLSSRAMAADPLFLKMVDRYDPISFLHPPEAVGFSFFRTAQTETGPDAPFDLPLPETFSSVPRMPRIALTAVNRPLLPDAPDYDREDLPAAAPAYPYWASDSVSGVVFPHFSSTPPPSAFSGGSGPRIRRFFGSRRPSCPICPMKRRWRNPAARKTSIWRHAPGLTRF